MLIVDGHMDLAWNALTFGRDYLRSVEETRALEVGTTTIERQGEATIGWPELQTARVALIFATLFVVPTRRAEPWEEDTYNDAASAHRLYKRHLEWYHRLADEHGDKFQLVRSRADVDAVLATWEPGGEQRTGLMLLMEGADGIREPSEVEWWQEQGVRMIGPSWAGTRYAGGTNEPGPITKAGRSLLDRMAALGLILDLSHMSDDGVNEALDHYGGWLCATHCAARARLPHSRVPERHLTDRAIYSIAERGGIIGIPLGNGFLKDGYRRDTPRADITVMNVVELVDYLCQRIGDAAYVGIGSDLDGGFGRRSIPTGIESVADLPRIGEALAARGYDDAAVRAIMGSNWIRFLRETLPAG